MMIHLAKFLRGKPHLFLEFDEHRGEAGLITRLEAFRDEVKEYEAARRRTPHSPERVARGEPERGEAYRRRRFVLPYFADHALAFSGAMRGVGIEARVLPPPDAHSIALGERYATGKECHAFAVLAGDLIRFSRSSRRGGEVFYFPGTDRLCLLAQYDRAMSILLDDLGVHDLEVLSPPARVLFEILGSAGLKLLWQGLVAVDLLVKAACERRPYERTRGLTDRVHEENLKDIEEGLAAGAFGPAWKRCVERLESIDIRPEKRPLIGIAGDIFTRQHQVANHHLYHRLERMGCEVWPGPFMVDDVDFGLQMSVRRKFKEKRILESLAAEFLHLRKNVETWKIKRQLKGRLERGSEPGFRQVLDYASPYLSPENNRVLLLNIAKMVDFARRGADGVVNVICLNCMLGRVSEAITARIRRDFGGIPIPTLVFSGADSPPENTKLEAFVYQVMRRASRERAEEPPPWGGG